MKQRTAARVRAAGFDTLKEIVMRELRNVGIGLVLGLLVSIAIGQAAAPKNAPEPHYQFTTSKDSSGNREFFILDHQTNKLYYRLHSEMDQMHQQNGMPIEKLLEVR